MNEGELMAHCVQRTCSRALQSNCNSPLVPSTRRVLAIDMVSFLHTSGTSTTSLSSARFIPDIVCISSIHFFLGRPLFLLPLPHASIVSFSIPFARITWPSSSVLLPSVSATKLLFLVRSPSVSTCLFSSLSKRPLASFSRSTFRRHQFSSPCLCPCLATIQYHWKGHCIYNSHFFLQTYVFVLPYLFKTLHCHFIQRYPPSYLLFASALAFYQGS